MIGPGYRRVSFASPRSAIFAFDLLIPMAGQDVILCEDSFKINGETIRFQTAFAGRVRAHKFAAVDLLAMGFNDGGDERIFPIQI